jgi:response regulator of citrate/malate metabolism
MPLPPIILMSAHIDLPVIARLHMVSGYLQKPIDAETLRETLDPFIMQPAARSSGPTLWRIRAPKGEQP